MRHLWYCFIKLEQVLACLFFFFLIRLSREVLSSNVSTCQISEKLDSSVRFDYHGGVVIWIEKGSTGAFEEFLITIFSMNM